MTVSDHDRPNWIWRTGPVEPSEAIIFDLDGTLADGSARTDLAKQKEWGKFFAAAGDDQLLVDNARLLDVVDPRCQIVLLTGRPLSILGLTLSWLTQHGLRWDLLVMRIDGDYSSAPNFKREAAVQLRDQGFELKLAFDDDPRNIEVFRSMGLACVYLHSGYYT